jgi:hypothetical protein
MVGGVGGVGDWNSALMMHAAADLACLSKQLARYLVDNYLGLGWWPGLSE